MSKLDYRPFAPTWLDRRTEHDVRPASRTDQGSRTRVRVGSLVTAAKTLVGSVLTLIVVIGEWLLFAAAQIIFPFLPFLGLVALFPLMAFYGASISAAPFVVVVLVLWVAAVLNREFQQISSDKTSSNAVTRSRSERHPLIRASATASPNASVARVLTRN